MQILIDRTKPVINSISDAVTPQELDALPKNGIIKTATVIDNKPVIVYGFKYFDSVGYSAIYLDGRSGGAHGPSQIISLIKRMHDKSVTQL